MRSGGRDQPLQRRDRRSEQGHQHGGQVSDPTRAEQRREGAGHRPAGDHPEGQTGRHPDERDQAGSPTEPDSGGDGQAGAGEHVTAPVPRPAPPPTCPGPAHPPHRQQCEPSRDPGSRRPRRTAAVPESRPVTAVPAKAATMKPTSRERGRYPQPGQGDAANNRPKHRPSTNTRPARSGPGTRCGAGALQPDEIRGPAGRDRRGPGLGDQSHDSSCPVAVRPPTTSTNTSSRSRSPRTCSSGPTALITPSARIATWVQSFSTTSMT